ncbi:sulfatase [Nonomuraea spiralis]|uniref:Sulfatase n=1 Tax=Nonomuraea spiralis TaxID=46182 RepID=A0ABV5IIN3_9ACTN|nr:sulfatase [Nonomuraea spiralis]GGS99214.1 N-acetylglucosamine-6-sulfatase [Nonomuraea spiralis]
MLKSLCRLFCLLLLLSPAAEPTMAVSAARPNIVFVMADDLESGTLPYFPTITSELVGKGMSFDRFFVTNSWCCPSRTSILRSQYVHSHGVLTNTAPEGGFDRFHSLDLERSTVGTWMQQAGYRTALMGKFLNHYPGATADAAYVPPGWNEWDVPVRKLYEEYGYRLNENGDLYDYGWGEQDYLSDVLAAKARDFITGTDEPFFLYLTPIGPHNPSNPAIRHVTDLPEVLAPRTPSFNQPDVSKEPLWLRSLPLMTPEDVGRVDERHRRRLRSMLGVDDLVRSVVDALRDSGKLDNTYIVFTSDNGFHLGTHRLTQGKTTPFEEAIKVPFVVRGPGIRPGSTIGQLGATVDIAPTIAELGGAVVPDFAEGRSLVSLLHGKPPAQWRKNVLVEFNRPLNRSSGAQTPVPAYQALRTERYTYVKYDTGERQLYDLTVDPYQLDNLAATAAPALLLGLDARLEAMRACSGGGCREADARQ